MKKLFAVMFVVMLVLSACGTSAPEQTAAPEVQVQAPATEAPATEASVATEAPATEASVATEAPATATEEAKLTISVPQQWNGEYNEESGLRYNMNLIVEKLDGTSFTGKLNWSRNGPGVLTVVKGEFIGNIDTATEQTRWAFHEDFKNGNKSGMWVRFTETDIIENNWGTNFPMNGWYYAHITNEGKMSGIYFYNNTDPEPAKASYTLTLVPELVPDLPEASTSATTFDPSVLNGPHQWNGLYDYVPGGAEKISLVIEKVNGDVFTGKMVWSGDNGVVITKVEGKYVTDFSAEQDKWNRHEDFKNGDKNGSWLTWTETGLVQGSGYTLGGWYYAHIREDGTMVGIYFLNPEVTSLSTDTYSLKLK